MHSSAGKHWFTELCWLYKCWYISLHNVKNWQLLFSLQISSFFKIAKCSGSQAMEWTEKPSRLLSMGSKRFRHNWARACTYAHTHTHTHTSTRAHMRKLVPSFQDFCFLIQNFEVCHWQQILPVVLFKVRGLILLRTFLAKTQVWETEVCQECLRNSHIDCIRRNWVRVLCRAPMLPTQADWTSHLSTRGIQKLCSGTQCHRVSTACSFTHNTLGWDIPFLREPVAMKSTGVTSGLVTSPAQWLTFLLFF